jgi:hypothetical protein
MFLSPMEERAIACRPSLPRRASEGALTGEGRFSKAQI